MAGKQSHDEKSAAAIEALQANQGQREHTAPGQFYGSDCDESKWRYFAIPLGHTDGNKEAKKNAVDRKRQELKALQYEPAPKSVRVMNVDNVEVWQLPRAAWEWRMREAKRRLFQNKRFAALQEKRQQPGHGFVPSAEELAEPSES